MKKKPVITRNKNPKKPTSVLQQLNDNLQNYLKALEALKATTEVDEYQQFSRLNR